MQAKLLRVLQEGEIRQLGEKKQRKIDVRVIAATNKDLRKEVEEGRFRSDLYYRLNTVILNLPPLRERKEDIPLLADHFLNKYNEKLGKKINGFTENAMRWLLDYNWPGNVRELEHQIERSVILATRDYIDETLFSTGKERAAPTELHKESLKDIVETVEKETILQALHKYKNKTRVAKALGLSRLGLRKKMKRYNIEDESPNNE